VPGYHGIFIYLPKSLGIIFCGKEIEYEKNYFFHEIKNTNKWITLLKNRVMKFLILFACLFLFFESSFSQVMWQVKTTTSKKWFLQENDEFIAEGLNTGMWKSGLPWGNYFYKYDLLFKQQNIGFNNGIASFITDKPANPQPIIGENLDTVFLKKKGIFPNEKGEYSYNYSGGCISSLRKYKYGYFEMRFKANAEKGTWPAFWLYGGNPNEEIDFYEGKGERDKQLHVDVHCAQGCEDYRGGFLNLKKNWGAWITTNESLADGWNIISGEWQPNYIKFFLNGQPLGYLDVNLKTAQNLIINNSVSKDKEAFNPGPDAGTKFPNSFLVDYVRVWSGEDTIYRLQNNYKVFQYTPNTIANADLYQTSSKKNVNFVYNKRELNDEAGCITLLPVFYNKYSLSVTGKKLGKIKIDVIDHLQKKVTGFELDAIEYYIMDLSELPTGPYDIKITVLGQTLVHNVPVINPKKIGDRH
jgi:beta-glucanase (GH16 family)